MLTKVKIKTNVHNPFEEEFVELEIPRKTKIFSDESYVKEAYELYTNGPNNDFEYTELQNGSTITAKIVSINKEDACLEVDSKHTVTLNLKKEDKKYSDLLQVGNEIKVKISKNNSNDFRASFSDAIKDNKFQEILDSVGKPVAYKAIVKELIHGGYLLKIDSIEVFMPGSLGGMNKLIDFNSLIGKELIVMPINYSKEKGTIVVSHREYLKTQVGNNLDKIRDNINDEYEGFITGTTKFGIFAQFGCLTGLIPMNELNDEWLNKFNNRSIKAGDKVKFLVKDIINENKIILTQLQKDLWVDIDKKYPPLSKAKGRITSIKNYGAFIELEKSIVGLLHISEFEGIELKENEEIEVIISKIDIDNKKIEFKKV